MIRNKGRMHSVGLVLLFIISIGIGFWFSFRPQMVRRSCAQAGLDFAQLDRARSYMTAEQVQDSGMRYTLKYESCVNQRGLSS